MLLYGYKWKRGYVEHEMRWLYCHSSFACYSFWCRSILTCCFRLFCSQKRFCHSSKLGLIFEIRLFVLTVLMSRLKTIVIKVKTNDKKKMNPWSRTLDKGIFLAHAINKRTMPAIAIISKPSILQSNARAPHIPTQMIPRKWMLW